MLIGLKPEEDGIQGRELGLKGEVFWLQAELSGLKGGLHGFKPGLLGLQENLRTLEQEESRLQPSEVGLEGEERWLQGERFPWKRFGSGEQSGGSPKCANDQASRRCRWFILKQPLGMGSPSRSRAARRDAETQRLEGSGNLGLHSIRALRVLRGSNLLDAPRRSSSGLEVFETTDDTENTDSSPPRQDAEPPASASPRLGGASSPTRFPRWLMPIEPLEGPDSHPEADPPAETQRLMAPVSAPPRLRGPTFST